MIQQLLQQLLGSKIDRDYGGSQFNPQNTGNSEGAGSSFHEPSFNQRAPQHSTAYGTDPDFGAIMEKLKMGRKRRMNPSPSVVGPLMAGTPGTPQVHPLRQLLNNMIGPR
tara:strand:+ start:2890 stop:3219 length:330 start_codon:yes stop_codon:yes gene_type:complete